MDNSNGPGKIFKAPGSENAAQQQQPVSRKEEKLELERQREIERILAERQQKQREQSRAAREQQAQPTRAASEPQPRREAPAPAAQRAPQRSAQASPQRQSAQSGARASSGVASSSASRQHAAEPQRQSAAKRSGNSSARKGGGKKKKGKTLLIVVLVVALLVSGLGVSGYFYFFRNPSSSNSYTINSQETLIYYITHPSLKSGDTLVVQGAQQLELADIGGFLSMPLVNYDCSNGSLTFSGGTVLMSSGANASFSLSGLSFSGSDLYIEAPNASIAWDGVGQDGNINAKSLNGSSHNVMLTAPLAGSKTTVSVAIENLSGAEIKNAEVQFMCSSMIPIKGETQTMDIPASGITIDVPVAIVAGGNEKLYAVVTDKDGNTLAKGESAIIYTIGPGYYAGDVQTYANEPDFKKMGTLEGNVECGYQNGMSFIYSVSYDDFGETLPQSTVDSLTGGPGSFLQLPAFVVDGTDLQHLLGYGYPEDEEIPYGGFGEILPEYGPWLRQSAVDQIVNAGGVVFIPHPFSYGLDIWDHINNMFTIQNVTALEILDPAVDTGMQEFTVSLNAWDNINVQGNRRMFGFGSGGNPNERSETTSDSVGARFIKGYMGELTESNTLAMLRSGNYFTSNGPQLTYKLGGVEMGGELFIRPAEQPDEGEDTVAAPQKTTLEVTCYDTQPLTRIHVVKYKVSGLIEDLSPIGVMDIDLTGQGVYSYRIQEEIEVEANEFVRVEVYSEKAKLYDDVGMAFSNPVWVSAANPNNPRTSDTGFLNLNYRVDYLGGILNPVLGGLSKSKMYQSTSGYYYIEQYGRITTNAVNYESSGTVRVNYHDLDSDYLVDKVTVWVMSEDGKSSRTETIYVLPQK